VQLVAVQHKIHVCNCCKLHRSIHDIFYFNISAIEINEDNLEDLLTYDDLFLDYFNAFLALPVSIEVF
jgi:hypothetical protein